MKLYRLPAESIGDHGRLIDAYLQAPEVRHGDFFYYPNISFSGYQWFSNEIKPWRFIFDENCFIWMMYREDVQQLIERTTLARPVTTVYGPKGSGKSFNLYLLVCHLRVQRNRYRVVYVNQTDFSLSSDLIRNFLSVTYDEIDAPARDMLLELFEIVDNFRTSEEKILKDFTKYLVDIEKYYVSKKLQMVFVLDQTNVPFTREKSRNNATDILQLFNRGHFKDSRVLLSSSPNGELSLQPRTNLLLAPKPFTLAQATRFLGLYPRFRPILNTAQRRLLLATTEGYPLELDYILTPKNDTNFDDKRLGNRADFAFKIRAYENGYRGEVATQHADWLDKLYATGKGHLAHAGMLHLLYGTSFSKGECTYDRNYVVDTQFPNDTVTLRPVSKLAMEAMLWRYTAENLLSPHVAMYNRMLADAGTRRATLGCAYENVITGYYQIPRTTIQWSLSASPRPFTILSSRFAVKYIYSVAEDVHLPMPLDKDYLFLPLGETFPGYDMFFLHKEHRVVYGVQITVSSDLSRKVRRTRATGKASRDAWAVLLGDMGFKFVELWFTSQYIVDQNPRMRGKLNFVCTDDMHIPMVHEHALRMAIQKRNALLEHLRDACIAKRHAGRKAQGEDVPSAHVA